MSKKITGVERHLTDTIYISYMTSFTQTIHSAYLPHYFSHITLVFTKGALSWNIYVHAHICIAN